MQMKGASEKMGSKGLTLSKRLWAVTFKCMGYPAWGPWPCYLYYANNVIYGGGLGASSIGSTSGGTRGQPSL